MRGSVVKRGDGRYSIVYRAPDPATGKIKQVWKGGFRTKKDAEDALKDVVRSIDEGAYVRPSKQTFGEYLEDDWLPSLTAAVVGGGLKPTTEDFYRRLVRAYVIPRLGGTLPTRLTPEMLERFYGELLVNGRVKGRAKNVTEEGAKKGLSPTTVHSVHVAVGRALADALRWRKVSRNVAADAKAPMPSKAERPVWSAEQLRRFLESVADDRLLVLWHLVATTGMRRGELAGVRWSDVDLDAGRLRVASTRVVVGYKVVEGSPKTARSARTIGLVPLTGSP